MASHIWTQERTFCYLRAFEIGKQTEKKSDIEYCYRDISVQMDKDQLKGR